MPSKSILAAFGAGLVVLIGAYQNCARKTHWEPASEHVEADPLVRKMNETTAITSSAKFAGDAVCAVSRLRCLKKVFSPDVDDSRGEESVCLADGLCLDVAVRSYDTRNAIASCPDCGAAAAAPGGAYNREEYTCWVGEPGSPEASAYALRDGLEDAAAAALDACEGRE